MGEKNIIILKTH